MLENIFFDVDQLSRLSRTEQAQCLEEADNNLYTAKHNGKNQWVFSSPIPQDALVKSAHHPAII